MFGKRSGAAAMVLAMGWPGVALAQGTSASGQVTVQEQVEVVATKVPVAPHDLPAAVEVIDGDTLRAIGATTLRDALSLAAGVEVGPGGDNGPAGSVPEFWGLREFDAFLLVVDGVPLGGAFNPALTVLNLRDVERIEVLRGSAPVSFGATSFVGVIHVVHKSAAANTTYASVTGGSYKSGGGAVDFAIPNTGDWKSRVSVSFDRQGYKDDETSFKRGQALFRAAKTDGNNITYVTADATILRQSPASPHARKGATLTTLSPIDANYNPAGAYLDDNSFSGTFGLTREIADARQWSFTVSFRHAETDMFRGFLTEVADVADNATGFKEKIDVNDIYVDTHLVVPASDKTRLVFGVDYLFGNGEAEGAVFDYTVPLSAATQTTVQEPTVFDRDAEARRQFFGAYGQAELTPSDRVRFTAGLRLNSTNERRGEGESVTHTKLSGSVGGIFTAWEDGPDHFKVFANYRDTFKPAVFDFGLAENEGVLDPETARSYEAGVKVRTASARVDFEASAFKMDFKNLVTSTVVDGLPSLQNAGTTRFQGVEFAADIRAEHAVTGRLTYSFHDAKFVDFTQSFDGVNTQLAGKRFEMSARHLFSAGLILAPRLGLVGDVIVKYTGNRALTKRNSAFADGFAVLNAGLGYATDQYEIRVDGKNLTDRRDPISESEVGDAQYYRMPARTVMVTLSIRR